LPADYHLDSEWSEVEKDLSHFPIAKPTDGWKTAERGLPSVVQGAAGERSRSTQFYYKKNVSWKRRNLLRTIVSTVIFLDFFKGSLLVRETVIIF